MPFSPCPPPPLLDSCLIVDGMTRTGKFMACNLVGALSLVEHPLHNPQIENICFMWQLGQMSTEAASTLISNTLSTMLYESIIGRHLNTRLSDNSSIYNSPKLSEIIKRTASPDGQAAVDAFISAKSIPLVCTHDALPSADLLFDIVPGLKFLHVVRHPVDVIDSWHRRQWGTRFGSDPLAFTVVTSTPSGRCPWWAVDWHADFFSLTNPIDRCIRGVLTISNIYRERISLLSPARQSLIKTITFEGLVTDPAKELGSIGDFLGTDIHEKYSGVFGRERVPRTLSIAARRAKVKQFQKIGAAPNFLAELEAASRDFERTHGLTESAF